MSTPREVLIIDDEPEVRWALAKVVEGAGMHSLQAEDGDAALDLLRTRTVDAIVMDMRIPGVHGLELIRRVRGMDGDVPIIVVTAYVDVHEAVQAVRDGAADYLTKPFMNDDIVNALMRALGTGQSPSSGADPDCDPVDDEPAEGDDGPFRLSEKMGWSATIKKLEAEVKRVAVTDFSVLIIGETGSGKELVAQAIRKLGNRAQAAFVAVDCGAIPPTLIESELFGHEKGAFTGADRLKRGRFEDAADGILFLDEVSNLPLPMQSKLLRALQERCFFRVGGNQPLHSRVRVLAATNRDLISDETSEFRRDLYYRLAEYVIRVPPLRERRQDVLFLARRFARLTATKLGKRIRGFSKEAVKFLLHHHWPGNVRELSNMMRRAVLLADDVVELQHLSETGQTESGGFSVDEVTDERELRRLLDTGMPFREILEKKAAAVERRILAEALRRTGGNKAAVARLLHLDYKTVHTKLERYGMLVPRRGAQSA